ncbi:MAG: apolipoprotein N-acyltransferase [Treponema sp.]|jgi:apolipoprotein N-acyltransferase|nr:apolipoprotein N-acyltransferase [Treponema sp.]
MRVDKNRFWGSILVNFGLEILGAVLFALSFPNLLIEKGLPLLGWVAFIPVFILIRRISLVSAFFWGALYGFAAYSLFNYWLSLFHPLAGLIVNSIYLVYLGLLFPFLKIAELLLPRKGYILQWCMWLAYEYLRTRGFLGYPYGISGYTQWTVLPLIQIASLFGVWGVSALVVFPSLWLGRALGDWKAVEGPKAMLRAVGVFFRRERLSALLWFGCLCAALVYGFVSPIDYSGAPSVRIALIQHNTDPWRGDMPGYWQNYRVLRRLSDEALAAEPKPDLVVWSETAFVPRIYWHTNYHSDQESWEIVRDLLEYLSRQTVPFVIGNDDARREGDGKGGWEEVDYNAVMLFEKGLNTQSYRKVHLVPFTEHFPYEKQFPWIYNALKNADTHFWKKGEEYTVFSAGGIKFSTPICFEDTFGYLSREFVRAGAEVIVNLSNDAWSHSLPAQNQHLSLAVFRAVENRRSMVRSTASGQTCSVDPNGKVLALAPPFTEAWLIAEAPVLSLNSLYTRWGDWLALIFVGVAFTLLIFTVALRIITLIKNRFICRQTISAKLKG